MPEPKPQSGNRRKFHPDDLYSAEAEKAVLGCMMAQPNEVIDDVIIVLKQEDFFVVAHQIIFEALKDMYEHQTAIDVITIHEYLKNTQKASEVGSPGILGELLVGFATHLNVGEYVMQVKQKSMIRRLRERCRKIMIATGQASLDAAVLFDMAEQEIFDLTREEFVLEAPTFEPILNSVIESVKMWADSQGCLRGLPTPFEKLNSYTTGICNEDVWIVGARPGVGKTALALTFMRELVRTQMSEETGIRDAAGYPVQFFSLEMKKEQIILRLLAMHASINMQSLRTGKITEGNSVDMASAAADMRTWPLFIDDSRSLDIAQIRARARRAKRKYGIRCVVIDYMQLIRCNSVQKHKGNREQEVAEISRQVKDMNRELGIPIMVLAQLNRKEENVEPALHHLRESGSIEQDADCVILIHDKKSEADNEAWKDYDLILAKQRNGPTGKVPLDFLAWKLLFTEKT